MTLFSLQKFKISMKQKNETTVLVLALVITLGLIGSIYWWFSKGSNTKLGSFIKNQSQPLELSNGSTFASIENVPSGLFNYGGSTTWAPIRKVVDQVIQRDLPQFRLRYTEPTYGAPGSGTGIKMLLNNQLAFSQSSRALQVGEYQEGRQKSSPLKEVPVAIDGIAVAINPSLDIPGLTIAQIKDIYTNKITNWQQIGGPNLPVLPYSRGQKEGGTVEFFVDNILQNEKFGSAVKFIPTTTQALREVASNRGGIYYASATEVVGQCTVKPLPVGRSSDQLVPPYKPPFVPLSECPQKLNHLNAAAFQSGEYPITRRLFVIVKQNGQTDQQAGEAYASLLLTNQGQELISKAGFVRIR